MLNRLASTEKKLLVADILTNAKDCIIILDYKHNIYYWNYGACGIFGHNFNDIIGNSIFSVLDWPELFNILYNLELEQQELIKELNTARGLRTYSVIFNKVTLKSTKNHYVVIKLSDITELIEAKLKAKKASLAKSEFLASLSHEVRTPLVGILGFCELLTKADLGEDEQEYIQTIEYCAKQLMGIVDRVLDLSKIEARQIEIALSPFNIRQLAEKTVNTMKPIINKKNLFCSIDIDDNVPANLVGDEVKIKQLLTNLVTNAIKYTQKGYIRIHISLQNIDNYNPNLVTVKLSVYDTGSGINPQQVRDIFNPFMQINGSDNFKGVGLGLAISKRLVEALGGNLWYEPNAEQGSIFSFSLNLAIAQEGTNETSLSYNTKAKVNEINVLLVEDVAISRRLIGLMLEQMGYKIIEAANGEECLKILNYCEPDIILMDMQMPILDGYKTTRIIRQNNKYKNIPIIALTAYAMTSDFNKCIEAGCSHYLSKPFTKIQLAELLNTCEVSG
ncbi:MAG: response regulator [Syntrophomonadaceae bacterium]|nr:response regulator [Syntrophomonadaceae bacterium]